MKTDTIQSFYKTLGIIALTASPLAAQEEKKEMPAKDGMMHHDAKLSKLVCMIRPVGDSNIKGTVVFEAEGDGVRVTAEVGGFEPNTKHGIHVHEFGDLGSDDATSAGGHFNPEGHDHAMPDKEMRHGGDLGNLEADGDGKATLSLLVKNITLDAGMHGILGRAVIIHAKMDDGGQPTVSGGNAASLTGLRLRRISHGGWRRSLPG